LSVVSKNFGLVICCVLLAVAARLAAGQEIGPVLDKIEQTVIHMISLDTSAAAQ
jgi:hypothetical protein